MTPMSINQPMDKQNVVYLYSGILVSLKKEWGTDTLQHRGILKHAKWKKPATEGHISYDSVYLKCPESANP